MTEPVAPSLRFCVDCRFHIREGSDKCRRWPETRRETFNLVTGEPEVVQRQIVCWLEREDGKRSLGGSDLDVCGPEGKYFQPKGAA